MNGGYIVFGALCSKYTRIAKECKTIEDMLVIASIISKQY